MKHLSRREFIRLTGLGIATTASTVDVTAQLSSGKKKLGIALVGLGSYSEGLLAPALKRTQFCELRGIVTGSPRKIPLWQKQYKISDQNIYSYDTMHEIANNPDIDVVYVVVPTALHLKYCEIAANAGKHVWCEKPMAMTPEECQRIIDACRKNGVQLAIGYRMQHEPNTRTMMEYQNHMPYGPLQHITAHSGYAGNGQAADHWRMKKAMGGGALYDMGVYSINGARFISGMEPIAVTASHEKSHPRIFKEVDETTYFNLEFPNGIIAECGTSVVKSPNKLRVDCQDGWYQLEPMQAYFGVRGTTSDGIVLPAITVMQQTLQMDNDALAIIEKVPVLVSGDEGKRDIHIVHKIFEAAATGKRIAL